MSTSGWIIMLTSVTAVTTLLAWCIYKVVIAPKEEKD